MSISLFTSNESLKPMENRNPYLSDPDVQLMLKFQQGDKEAFVTIMRKYYPLLLNFNYKFLGNKEIAEDMTQEVFLRIYKSISKYTPKASFRTWAYKIARNLCLNVLRRNRHLFVSLDQPVLVKDDKLIRQIEDRNLSKSDEEVTNRETAELIKAAIHSLPIKQRMVVIMRTYDNFSYKEIACILSISVSAVKSLLSRARATLKSKLEGEV